MSLSGQALVVYGATFMAGTPEYDHLHELDPVPFADRPQVVIVRHGWVESPRAYIIGINVASVYTFESPLKIAPNDWAADEEQIRTVLCRFALPRDAPLNWHLVVCCDT